MLGYLLPFLALVSAAPDSDTKKIVASSKGVTITVLVDDFAQDNTYISPDISISDSEAAVYGNAYLVVQKKRGSVTNIALMVSASRIVPGTKTETVELDSASYRGGEEVRLLRSSDRSTTFSFSPLEIKRHALNGALDIKLYFNGGGTHVINIPMTHIEGITEVAVKP